MDLLWLWMGVPAAVPRLSISRLQLRTVSLGGGHARMGGLEDSRGASPLIRSFRLCLRRMMRHAVC